MGYFDKLKTVETGRYTYARIGDDAHWLVDCPACGSGSMLAVATGDVPAALKQKVAFGGAAWLMCSVCGMGAFAVGKQHDPDRVYPRSLPFDVPKHLEEAVEETWLEALQSFSASAYTSCTLMCRKIIFHMAVEAGLPAKNDRGWAPRFDECVDKLVEAEYITPRQKDQWVDSIREWGNAATHELEPISKDVAHHALEFTHELLRMVYTFSAAAQESNKALESAEKKAIPLSSGQAPTPSSGVPLD